MTIREEVEQLFENPEKLMEILNETAEDALSSGVPEEALKDSQVGMAIAFLAGIRYERKNAEELRKMN